MKPLLLLFLPLLCVHADLASLLDSLSGKPQNVADRLTKLISGVPSLLKAGRPVGTLVTRGGTVDFKSDSDEQEAIEFLFEDIPKQINNAMNGFKEITGDVYGENVYVDKLFISEVAEPMKELRNAYQLVLNPDFKIRSGAIGDFKEKCKSLVNFTMITRLDKGYNTPSCILPTPKAQSQYLLIIEAIDRVEEFFRAEIDKPWQDAVLDLTEILHRMSENEIGEALIKLEQARSNSSREDKSHSQQSMKTALAVVTEITAKFAKESSICTLQAAFDGGNRKRSHLDYAIVKLYEQMSRMILFASPCSNIVLNSNSEALDVFDKKFIERFKSIQEYVVEWRSQALKLDSVELDTVFRLAKIDLRKSSSATSDTVMDKHEYFHKAQFFQDALEKRGLPEYEYQVIMTRPLDPKQELSVRIGDKKNYAKETSFIGTDIHVFRHDKGKKIERGNRAKEWFDSRKDIMAKAIDNKSTDSCSAECHIKHIESKLNEPLISNQTYTSAMFLSNHAWFESDSHLWIGNAVYRGSYGYFDAPAHSEITKHYKQRIGWNYDYTLYFFL